MEGGDLRVGLLMEPLESFPCALGHLLRRLPLRESAMQAEE